MREIEHKDYFGNLIKVGDEIIMPLYSELLKRTVAKVTPGAVFLNSTKYANTAKPDEVANWQTVPSLLRKDAKWFAGNIIVLNKITIND